MPNLDKLNKHLTHIQDIIDHIKKKHLKQLAVPEIIDTPDGKRWIYDERNGWIEVTNPKKGKFVRLSK